MTTKSFNLTESEARLCEAISAKSESLAQDLERYVSIPTGWSYQPGLEELRGLVVGRLEALGASVRSTQGESAPSWLWGGSKNNSDADATESQPIAPIVVCDRTGSGGCSALIASHLDTVFDPKGSFVKLEVSPDGKTAVGPGVVDMKGGIVIALAALESLEEVGIPVSWSYLFNSDEETGSYHSAAALSAEAVKHTIGLCTEPALPGGELAIERGGSGQFMIECTGKSAHVGRAFGDGVSAVTALAKVLVEIADLPDAATGRVVSVGPLQGGVVTNAVPDLARAWGNVRYVTEEMGEELGALLDELATDEGALPSVKVFRSFNRPAKPLTPGVKRLAGLAQSCAAALGQSLPTARTGGVCDGNILQQAGLPTIDTLGVRGGGLHTPDEWIELSSLTERCQLLALTLSRFAVGEYEAQ